MKQKLLILFAFLLIGISSKVQAFDFSAAYNGKIIYYSTNSTTAPYNARVRSGQGSYTGIISIPYSVTYGGITYSVTSIEKYAFSECSGLASISIPNSVTSIGDSAFFGCSGLTSITIPNSVTSIGSYAFRSCSGLTSITLSNSVTSIGKYTFNGCSGLTSILIPGSVTSIGSAAFAYCSGLTSINVNSNNIKYTSIDGVLFNKNAVTIIAYPGGKQGDNYIIPNSVTSIGGSVFYGCSGLSSITIPNSVTSIGSSAFSSCSGLTSIIIPSSVTSIGDYTFYDCSGLTSIAIPNSVSSIGVSAFEGSYGLTSITIPDSVSYIGYCAFKNCTGLTSIIIPNSVTSIGNSAFSGCTNLGSIICKSINPPSISLNTLNFSQSNLSIYVPCSSKVNYMSAPYWNIYSNYIGISDSSKYISEGICKGQFYSQNGFNVDSAGIYIRKIQGNYGCDSLVVLTIYEYPSYLKIIKDAICQGQIYSQNGFYADSTGQYINHYQTINGCDSIITLNLHVGDYNDTIYASICQGQVYTQNGFNTSYAGIYQKNMQTIHGCDSIITLNLTVNSQTAPSNFTVTKINNNFELTWQGNDSIYMVYRNDSLLSIVTNNIYLDSNLIDGKLYCYKIKAKNGLCESSFSNLVCKSFSSLDDGIISNSSIRIYPNPANNETKIQTNGFKGNIDLVIYDLTGEVIKTYSINQNKNEIVLDLSGFSKGLYTIKISDKKTQLLRKLIIE